MCAVLCPHAAPGGAGDPVFELEEALLRRGVDIVRCRDAYDAMAELVLHEAARREGRSHDPLIVILVEPTKHGESARSLYEAARRYAPHAAFWGYETGPTPRLAAYAPEPSMPAPVRAPAAVAPGTNGTPVAPTVVVRAPAVGAGVAPFADLRNARDGRTPDRPTLRLAGENGAAGSAARGEGNGSAPRVHVGRATAQALTHEELEMLTREEAPAPRAVAPGG